jgi:hypothetical protein
MLGDGTIANENENEQKNNYRDNHSGLHSIIYRCNCGRKFEEPPSKSECTRLGC